MRKLCVRMVDNVPHLQPTLFTIFKVVRHVISIPKTGWKHPSQIKEIPTLYPFNRKLVAPTYWQHLIKENIECHRSLRWGIQLRMRICNKERGGCVTTFSLPTEPQPRLFWSIVYLSLKYYCNSNTNMTFINEDLYSV